MLADAAKTSNMVEEAARPKTAATKNLRPAETPDALERRPPDAAKEAVRSRSLATEGRPRRNHAPRTIADGDQKPPRNWTSTSHGAMKK